MLFCDFLVIDCHESTISYKIADSRNDGMFAVILRFCRKLSVSLIVILSA
ncbi:hypothetical protein [Helicobacter sp. T3_23-1056]